MATKSVVRSVKNVTKGYSSVEVKVRNATSNDAWGPSGTDMSEIAQMTFNSSTDFHQIMDMLDKRLNDKGKNWRHVLKSLKVLDYCLHEGSEHVVTWARKNIYIIKTLREFQYVDDDGRDVGLNVRTSAKELTSLILDEERLRAERHDRKLWKSRVTGLDDGYGNDVSPTKPKREPRKANRQNEEDDLEYRLAIEASKNEAEEERKRRQSKGGDNDDDLQKAIKLSKEEEELRRRELEEQNATSLFDDTPVQQAQPTGWNQGYQQQGAVDWFGNPVDQQQAQTTGFLNNAYNQPTGFQNAYGYGQPQQQQFGFDQSQFQPQQQQQPQQQFLQPQQTAFNMNNPYGSMGSNGFGQQQQQPMQSQEEQSSLNPGTNNPWASNQSSSQDAMKPQPTGSNNPFASSFNRPQPQNSFSQRPPTLSTLQEQKAQTQFNLQPQPQPTMSQAPPSMTFSATGQPPKEDDPHLARLNHLLSTGEGQDTFGNVGDLRIPAQHTAPGTFINSAGSGINRLGVNQTGAGGTNNPFYMQTQFTGMPQTQIPAQTGPAGAFGNPSPFGANPYGSNPQQAQQQRQGGGQQGGSLIDL